MLHQDAGLRRQGGWALLFANFGVALAYVGWAALVDLIFRRYGYFPAPLWLPASVALVAVALWGPRAWPGLAAGAFIANAALVGVDARVSAVVSVGNVLGASLGVLLFRRVTSGAPAFFGVRDATAFVAFPVLLHAAVAALFGTAALVLSGRLDASPAASDVFLRWWMADAGGVLALAPAIALWLSEANLLPERERPGEFAVASALLLISAAALFLDAGFSDLSHAALPWLLLVGAAWLAVRFSVRASYTLFATMVGIALVGTVVGRGPFGVLPHDKSLFHLGIYLVTGSLLVMLCGGLANEWRHATKALADTVAGLERRVAEATAETRENARQILQLLEQSPFPLVMTVLDTGIVLFINERAGELFGVPPHEAPGKVAPDFWVERGQRDAFVEALKAAGRARDMEVVLKDAAGEPFTALISAIITTFDGQRVLVVGVANIEDRRRTEDALRAAKTAAEQASRAKSVFLAKMSHELRTPLNAVIGFSEVIATEAFGSVAPKYREYAGDINASGRHLLQLIDELLDLARIEAGRTKLVEETVAIEPLVREAVRMCQQVGSAESQVAVHLDLPFEEIRADARALRQMLLNLLGNAFKFSPDGGQVEIALRWDGTDVMVEVSDEGIGIPEHRLAEVGKPFVQVDDGYSRRQGGTGIGLFITRSLAELHGGSLEVARRTPKGTRVTIRLPGSRVIRRAPAEAEGPIPTA
ncbi:sensor histidine kinase [Arenibaculum pallidiluteum]|uniref:sensor histidine kinase n=1 Tax=Arenibaculum pallidiluteum TaxID=2812559 RepID=UPI001A968F00|nr:ATP-binding protein [Arenibaculum pallidiluteum]